MSYHAKLSPSSASRWTDCSASISAQEGLSDDGSDAARLGTCCHQLSAECLEHGFDAQDYLGRKMLFWVDASNDTNGEDWANEFGESPDPLLVFLHEVTVTQDMIDACQSYIGFVQQQVELSGATIYVEQRVPIGHITGEDDAGGTSDVVMAASDTLTTIDAKFGRAKVMAYDVLMPAREDIISGEMLPEVVRMNLQLALYLLGSLEKYKHTGNFTQCKAIIVQPYLKHVSEFSCSVDELLALGEWLKARAEDTRTSRRFAPSQDNCHFCKARMTCKAREQEVLSTALADFDDIDAAQPAPIRVNHLGSLYEKVGMIQGWCKDVMTRMFDELSSGNKVMNNSGLHYKLVTGKKGNRQFDDPVAVEALMKVMRLKADQMYTRNLITPTTAEALANPVKKGKQIIAPPVLGPTQWARLEAHITQSAGSPTIALETDPRPAIAQATADFDDVAEAASNCSDLF